MISMLLVLTMQNDESSDPTEPSQTLGSFSTSTVDLWEGIPYSQFDLSGTF